MSTSRTIQITQYGGPEVMNLVDLPVGEPGPGEIRIRHQACGLNYIDVYQRTGLYQNPLPLSLGISRSHSTSPIRCPCSRKTNWAEMPSDASSTV